MNNGLRPESMTAAERLEEISEILSQGFLRLQTKQDASYPNNYKEAFSYNFPAETSISGDKKSAVISIPMPIKRSRGIHKIILPEYIDEQIPSDTNYNDTLIRAFAKAYRWNRMLDEGKFKSINELAAKEKVHHSYCARILNLTLIAPDIIEAIADGKQPKGLLLADFMRPFPMLWEEQRKLFGFLA